jgi:hypothetical protein
LDERAKTIKEGADLYRSRVWDTHQEATKHLARVSRDVVNSMLAEVVAERADLLAQAVAALGDLLMQYVTTNAVHHAIVAEYRLDGLSPTWRQILGILGDAPPRPEPVIAPVQPTVDATPTSLWINPPPE